MWYLTVAWQLKDSPGKFAVKCGGGGATGDFCIFFFQFELQRVIFIIFVSYHISSLIVFLHLCCLHAVFYLACLLLKDLTSTIGCHLTYFPIFLENNLVPFGTVLSSI